MGREGRNCSEKKRGEAKIKKRALKGKKRRQVQKV